MYVQLQIVGSSKALGEWDVAAAPTLSWTPGDVWTWEAALYPCKAEFKV